MLGGKIIGEGVDGCVSKTPMWPCVAGTEGIPSPDDTHYVSKIVSNKDTEPELLKMAAELLGPDLSSKYLAKLQGECKPANPLNPPSQKNAASMAQTKANIQAWQRKGQACGELRGGGEPRVCLHLHPTPPLPHQSHGHEQIGKQGGMVRGVREGKLQVTPRKPLRAGAPAARESRGTVPPV